MSQAFRDINLDFVFRGNQLGEPGCLILKPTFCRMVLSKDHSQGVLIEYLKSVEVPKVAYL